MLRLSFVCRQFSNVRAARWIVAGRVISLLHVLNFSSAVSAAAAPAGWRAGVARADITPVDSVWMGGYAARTRPADGSAPGSPALFAKALVLEDAGGSRVALVSLDLLGIDRPTSDRIRGRLNAECGLARGSVALCASHTHSGPVVGDCLRVAYPYGDAEAARVRAYTDTLVDRVVDLVHQAAAGLAPADVRYGVGSASFAVNRRANKEALVDALTALDPLELTGWHGLLAGPTDPDLPVLAVRDPAGRTVAVLFGYACHATTLSGYDWSPDWPGYAAASIEAAQPGSTALFVAGCGADQNPMPRRTVGLAAAFGRRAAAGVSAVLAGEMTPVTGPLVAGYREVELPFALLPSRERLDADQASSDPKQRFVARRAAMLLERVRREGPLPTSYPYPVQTWRLGPAGPTLVLLGGEPVVDYALRLKRELGGGAAGQPNGVWPIGYANDVMGYIPSRRVLAEGGYEGRDAAVYYGLPAPWAAEVEERIVAEVKRQVAGE
ncbi:MAG: Neutral/alkaline non-lysosomal ceramidase [Phycisphaerales bacterium]|nr:Neutral/alkaline non-lysosomal ceramidase [Phycisphaerales bacterium]